MVNRKHMYKFEYGPPNTICQMLGHPSGANEAIELALFNSHRYAFYYWIKWGRGKSEPCDLISFDWHQDLVFPESPEKVELEVLDVDNLNEVAFYTWARMRPLNDTQILAAAYLNRIKDVWVVCDQGTEDEDWEDKTLIDRNGQEHIIRKFKTPDELFTALQENDPQRVYLDVDMDYFTIENNSTNGDFHYTYKPVDSLADLFSSSGGLMEWILQRTEGITIALEPECTGGLTKSLELWKIIEEGWFTRSIGPWDVEWRHLM